MKYLPVLSAAAVAVTLSCSTAPDQIMDNQPPRVNVAAAPRLAYIEEDGEGGHEYGTMRIDGSDRRPLLTLTGQPKEPTEFGAPRGDKLVVTTVPDAVTPAKLTILDLARGRRVATITAPEMGPSDKLIWTPDQTAFLAGSVIVDAATGETVTPNGIGSRSRQAQWSADGKYLAGCGPTWGSSSPALRVWARDGRQAPAVRHPDGNSPGCTAWVWIGNRVLFSTAPTKPEVFSYTPQTGKVSPHSAPAEQRHGAFPLFPPEDCPAHQHVQAMTSESVLTREGTWKPRNSAFSCDRVFSADRSRWAGLNEDEHLVIGQAGSASTTQLTFDSDELRRDYTFIRDGRHLLFQNGVELFVGDGERQPRSLGAVYSWSYSAQTGRLAMVRHDRRAVVVTDPVTTGRQVERRLPGRAHSRVRLAPDGRYAVLDVSRGHAVIDLTSGGIAQASTGRSSVYWPYEFAGKKTLLGEWDVSP